jgi:hypothetical protein
LTDVQTLSSDDMQGRAPGTPGSALARAYILKRFGEIGLAPIGAGFEQPFSYDKRDGTKVEAVNLVARIPEPARAARPWWSPPTTTTWASAAARSSTAPTTTPRAWRACWPSPRPSRPIRPSTT